MICTNEFKSKTSLGAGRTVCLVALAVLALVPLPISAQKNPTIAGDYAGTLGPLHVKLHLKESSPGKVTGTLDSPDRGVIGIHCANFHVSGQSVTFTVPALQGMWIGTVAADGTLTGSWDQGRSLPLNFSRDIPVPEDKTYKASL